MAGLMSSLGSLGGALGGAAVGLSYQNLKSKYQDFSQPEAVVEFNGQVFQSDTMVVTDISVEATCGFEASVATLRLYGVFDIHTGKFRYSEIEKNVILGASFVLKLGYLGAVQPVFVGFISHISFGFESTDLPYIEVTAMDVKGVMMANSYAQQLTSHSYGEAVSEILKRTSYEKLRSANAITAIYVTDTPDKQANTGGSKASAETIEMVEESDYDFVVKAAKKFNYEFFVDRGEVYFRKAKSDASILMELGVGSGLVDFEIGYDITGLVGNVEVRSMNPGTGKVITAKKKLTNNLSTGTRAKGIISSSKKVYIDPTVTTQEQADARAAYLAEEISYRLGSLECTCPGIPDLVPGRFVKVTGLGVPVDNTFYITSVIHEFREDTGYRTRLIAKASEVRK